MKLYIYYLYWLFRTWKLRRNFPKITISNAAATINYLIKTKSSFSRFGDGELRLAIKQRDIVFEKLDKDISERLVEVLNSNLENHMVGLPFSFKEVKGLKRIAKIHWINFINQQGNEVASIIGSHQKQYYDSFISRFYIDYTSKSNAERIIPLLKQIWADQEVLIVEGEFSRLGIGNDLFNQTKSIKRILAPSKNAYSSYKEILTAAMEYGKNKLILIALGPTATILAYDLAKLGYWAIDIGHVDVEYMWYLQNAKSKVSLMGRYVAESGQVPDITIPEQWAQPYNESVILKIGKCI